MPSAGAGYHSPTSFPPFGAVTFGAVSFPSGFSSFARMPARSALFRLFVGIALAASLAAVALDVDRLLWTAEGKPRLSIVSIAPSKLSKNYIHE